VGKYIGFAGSLASIMGLFLLDSANHPNWRIAAFVVGFVALLVAAALEIYTYVKNKPLKFNRQENIDYMQKNISIEGQVIIFAGNLSWVDNDKIKKAMIDKGAELSLCVKHTAPYLDEFRAAGVKVYTYGDSNFSPKTRFTIIRPDSTNGKIAITAVLDDHRKEKRLVYEIKKDGEDFQRNWMVYAAEDMFNLVKILNGEK